MTMTMLGMGKTRVTQISLIWITMSLTALSRCESIPRITNLGCLNDLHKKMFCFWEVVNSNSNCIEDFELLYEDFQNNELKCHDLRNEQFGDYVVPNKCICDIPMTVFVIAEQYKIKVKSHGELVANTTIHIGSTIKPIAPLNVQVDFQKELFGVVRWDIVYTSTQIRDNLIFQVQIICKHNRHVTIEDNVTQTNLEYYFNKKTLKPGENYVVRVRVKPVTKLQGIWSEWSSEAEWKNDYSLTMLKRNDIVIIASMTCLLVLCLIASYIYLPRYKRKWWDNIPDPKKSLIVKRNLIQKHQSVPGRRYTAKKSCGNFFSRIVKAHKSKCGQLTRHSTGQHYVIDIGSSDSKTCFFEPKNEDIVRYVELHPKREDENNPVQEGQSDLKAEDHPFEEDLSIANMFFSILCDSSNEKVDTFENLHLESFGCSVSMNSFDKEEKQQSRLNVPLHQKLGYHNYDSDDSSLDFPSSIDVVKMPYFDQQPNNDVGCIHNTPQVSMKENCLNQSKGDLLASSGYNSFAKALSEARKDFITDTTNTVCSNNFSKSTILVKSNIYDLQLNPKNILYYNGKYLSSHIRDSFQPTMKPKARQIPSQIYESTTDPSSISPVSGYQSFDQAVKENELESGGDVFGYKSFDIAVRQGDETSVNEINEYQSFSQAVQENCPLSGYHISEYKSFDQAVRQGDDTSAQEVSGYQSFDEAVQERETSESENCSLDSGYKSFESQTSQNNDYLDENGCMCENDHLKGQRCENTNLDNNREYRVLSSGLMNVIYSDFRKATEEKCQSFVHKPVNAPNIPVSTTLKNSMAAKHEGIPMALTFDICEHLRNLENIHRHKVPLNNLKNGTIPLNEAIFLCHLDKGSFTQEQLTINRNLTLQKFPATTHTSFFWPPYDLDLDSSQTNKHLLIQQSSLDKDGNSYMKIK